LLYQVEPVANQYNQKEHLNLPLLRQMGDLGLLGLTVKEDYAGSAMDATAVVMTHEELSYADPALCLSYLAHTLLLYVV
jgi:isovaleryl-CoA dehydrogenase